MVQEMLVVALLASVSYFRYARRDAGCPLKYLQHSTVLILVIWLVLLAVDYWSLVYHTLEALATPGARLKNLFADPGILYHLATLHVFVLPR